MNIYGADRLGIFTVIVGMWMAVATYMGNS